MLHVLRSRDEEVALRIKKWAADTLRVRAETCGISRLKIKTVQIPGFAVGPAILEYANHNDIDMIVMGTHGRRGMRFFLLGSIADEVVRLVPCPVLTLRPQNSKESKFSPKRILVPVDYSKHALTALIYAKELAASFNAEIQFLHVIENGIYPDYYISARCALFDPMPELGTKRAEALEKLIAQHTGPEIVTSVHVAKGRAANEIAKFAESHQSDLIVMATHGLRGIEHLILGSITEKVVRLASCPVFTVKTLWNSTPELFDDLEGPTLIRKLNSVAGDWEAKEWA
jgi:nucleotide-binding universal stress UspA family protein